MCHASSYAALYDVGSASVVTHLATNTAPYSILIGNDYEVHGARRESVTLRVYCLWASRIAACGGTHQGLIDTQQSIPGCPCANASVTVPPH